MHIVHSLIADLKIKLIIRMPLNNLERNFNEKIVEFNAHFEQIGNLLNNERKSWLLEVMSNVSRIIEEKID